MLIGTHTNKPDTTDLRWFFMWCHTFRSNVYCQNLFIAYAIFVSVNTRNKYDSSVALHFQFTACWFVARAYFLRIFSKLCKQFDHKCWSIRRCQAVCYTLTIAHNETFNNKWINLAIFIHMLIQAECRRSRDFDKYQKNSHNRSHVSSLNMKSIAQFLPPNWRQQPSFAWMILKREKCAIFFEMKINMFGQNKISINVDSLDNCTV